MKIVVTDSATLNPGDLSWDELYKLGDCDIYERSTYEENLIRCKDANIVVTNKVVFDREAIKTLGKLEELTLVEIDKFNFIDGKKIKLYKSRIGRAEIKLENDDATLHLFPNRTALDNNS